MKKIIKNNHLLIFFLIKESVSEINKIDLELKFTVEEV